MKFRIAYWLLIAAAALSAAQPAKAQTPYLAEIRFVAFNFAPEGWALCDGQLMSIRVYPTLYNLIGTTFGGDGINTFALPNLQGRAPVGTGTGTGLTPRVLGATGGQESVTLTLAQIPPHRHALKASTAAGNSTAPAGGVLANSSTTAIYNSQAPTATMNAKAIGEAGSGHPVGTMPPFLGLTCIIALQGTYPSPN